MHKELYREEEIVNGCIRNDRRMQEVLYRRHARKMYGICLGYAGSSRDLAQDMLQEAFIKVFRNIKQYSGKGSLEGWIRRIVTNTAIDILRKQSQYIELINDEAPIKQDFKKDDVLSAMAEKDILSTVARLPEGARIIFNLYALEGYSHQEIAERLEISPGTSKSQYSRARHLLQKWLQLSDS
jgi:RNA polymerase sigma factor (sigma-70 family)